ncbi:FAD-dependent oxidoreductase [Jannaschia seohaensis]|uniref:3-(3-hydroxy-phenyl)propionate hydroxylase n=1 Tax=Jannaschia seohaensis TaxID=475081 RepID=A0A2Y9A2K2_9RHOB|nr:FAD-dependent oxidoreductase [Jannaschia seohaensis]PWJ21818.1 3-(3-hydroxy-phenyl)propionate hydroxylase [Jannaschia seohaensis]SSA38096.1 3-(3-hydroxy-phenyl)propionate hydroxylase [Jannaschia seohaensis]
MLDDRYDLEFRLWPYGHVPDQDTTARHPVVIVGAGPVGLALALDLSLRGTPALVLDDSEGAGMGSKAICFSKRTLDIATRLGAGAPMVEKGVVWQVGRVFHRDAQVFEFDLQPDPGHRNPAFINLQQPYFERDLFEAIQRAQAEGAPIEIRGRNRVTAVDPGADGVRVEIDTPDGPYALEADWLVACDGARSPTRTMLGLGFEGRVFEDNFLIADVRMTADFPTERWFWFQPPFDGAGDSALLHKQPDDIWRIDFQLGWEIERSRELEPDRIRARVDAMLSSQTGTVPDYELVWTSIYTFQCRRMERFRHGRVLFAGDSAHQVSPFGARGANSGVQDADNLAWKLDLVLRGHASDALIDSYASEREEAADENILNSSRATDFMTPKTEISRMFRDAVLDLAGRHAFARPMVNSGRLSTPCTYRQAGEDALGGPPETRPGAACVDAPVGEGFLLERLPRGFTLLAIGGDAPPPAARGDIAVDRLHLPAPTAELAARYLGDSPSAVYLIRPDLHIAARWPDFDARAVDRALAQALGERPCL